jgi:hypothetical protein
LFKDLKKAFKRSALLSSSIAATAEQSEHTLTNGLGESQPPGVSRLTLPFCIVMGHAYGLIDVRVIHKLPMVQLRNPWFGLLLLFIISLVELSKQGHKRVERRVE